MKTLQQITNTVYSRIQANLMPELNTEEKIYNYVQYMYKKEAQDYLNSTDWYIIRKMERNIEVPEEISQNRLAAIAALNED